MKKTFKGILIDPFTQTLTEVVVEDGLDGIYKTIDCTCIDIFRIEAWTKGIYPGLLYVDDEALLRGVRKGFYVMYASALMAQNVDGPGTPPRPLMGKALWFGNSEDGDSADAPVSIEKANSAIVGWYDGDTPEPKIVIRTIGGRNDA